MPDVLSEVFDPSSNVQVAIVTNLWYEGETGKLKSLAAGKSACIFVDPSTGNAYWRTFNASSANEEVTAWASDVLIAGNYDAAGTAAAAVAAHASASDPHTGYQKESEKGQASGYAELDSGGSVPLAQLANNAALPTLTQIVYDSGDTLNGITGAANTTPVQLGNLLFTTHVARIDSPGGATVLKIVPPAGWVIGSLAANAEANATARAAAIDTGLPDTGKIQWYTSGATNVWVYASVTYVKS